MNTAKWLVPCLAILAISLIFQLGSFAYALYALAGLIALSRLMGHYSLESIEETRRLSRNRIHPGETAEVEVSVRNAKPFRVLWALAEDTAPEALRPEGDLLKVATLKPYGTLNLRYRLTGLKRGYHRVGPVILESGDLFGLVRRFKVGEQAQYLTVFPKVVEVSGYAIPALKPVGEVRLRRSLFEDPTRLVGVREYRHEDSMKRIHWKTTARTGSLYSKIYEPTTMIGANLVVDFHRDSYDAPGWEERLELAATVAASLGHYILSQSQQVGLLSNGRDAADRIRQEKAAEALSRSEARKLASQEGASDRMRPVELLPRKGDEQRMQLLEALARLELSSGLSVSEMLWQEHPGMAREAAVVVIAPRAPRGLLQVLGQIHRVGFVVALFVVQNFQAYAEAAGLLAPEHIPVFHVGEEWELHDITIHRI
ncbi:MAG: DUF58 domain-containing protein [Armatimonadetes bacterium]|nr:DUF58 domain-containing protein [Armatimonadota bacterium]